MYNPTISLRFFSWSSCFQEATDKDMQDHPETDANLKALLADAYLHPIFNSFEEVELVEVKVDKNHSQTPSPASEPEEKNQSRTSSPLSELTSPSPTHQHEHYHEGEQSQKVQHYEAGPPGDIFHYEYQQSEYMYHYDVESYHHGYHY